MCEETKFNGPAKGQEIVANTSVAATPAPLILPQEGCINLNTCVKVTDISKSNLLRKIKDKRFPQPFRYGGLLLFSVDEIRRWLKNPATYCSDKRNSKLTEEAN